MKVSHKRRRNRGRKDGLRNPSQQRRSTTAKRRVKHRPKTLLDLKWDDLTPSQRRRVGKATRQWWEAPLRSPRGRRIDPKLRSAWIEWEMAPTDKKPSYFQLAKKHYGNGQRYRENVKKGILRLRRQLEETTRRAARIQKLLAP